MKYSSFSSANIVNGACGKLFLKEIIITSTEKPE